MKQGVNAPKDPIAKKSGFYVMKQHNIGVSETEHENRFQDIYLDGGRIENAAWIQGGAPEEIREKLGNQEGFREIVHAIGYTVESNNGDAKIQAQLMFYGKSDKYVSGTKIVTDVYTNGVEQLVDMASVNWSDDDVTIGKMTFTFPEELSTATVSVKFYLNDGYSVPEQEEDQPVDVNSDHYKNMIANSFMQLGSTKRFKKAVEKARNGEDVTVAFIGGSITQGAGAVPIHSECYAYKTYEHFKNMFGKGDGSNVHFVKAGIGGTPSELGMVRYEKDVSDFGKIQPDLVVVEFAVNDADDETQGHCYEALVRKIWNSEQEPAVILLFAVFANDWNLQDRFIPLGKACELPMVSIMDAVTPQFSLSEKEGKVLSKGQFFYDMFHPTNTGHQIMADCIAYYFAKADEAQVTECMKDLPVVMSDDFEKIRYVDRKHIPSDVVIEEKGFSKIDEALQYAERNADEVGSPMFPDNWMWDGSTPDAKPFTIKLCCKAIVLLPKDSDDNAFGEAVIRIDGKEVCQYNPSAIGWTHCGSKIVLREDTCKEHVVEIAMADGQSEKSFTILGFGYVRD